MADGWWAGKLEQNNQSVLPLLSLETWREPEGIWYLFLRIISSFQAQEHQVWKRAAKGRTYILLVLSALEAKGIESLGFKASLQNEFNSNLGCITRLSCEGY